MQRLVKEMFQDITFASYLPGIFCIFPTYKIKAKFLILVFNIWALYRESAQSGIGVGGKPLVSYYANLL
jgi:hypothetical protein